MTNPFDPPSEETPGPATPAPPPYGQAMPPYGQSMPPYAAPQYGYGQPQYGQPQYGYPPAMRNGLGTTALVLGIIGAVAGATLVLFFLAFILGVLAVVFGLIGRGRAKRGEASNKTAATWGFALGVVALVLSVVGGVFLIRVGMNRQDCREHAVNQQQYDDCNNVWWNY